MTPPAHGASATTAADFAHLQSPPEPRARWENRPCDAALAGRLAAGLNAPALVGRILAARGIADAEAGSAFLRPVLGQLNDPMLLKGMDPAVERIGRALRNEETIWIYGDYDVDGVTAMAVLREALLALGGRVDYYIPHRLSEGYGLHPEAIEELARERKATLIVTVDCGISAVAEAALARELGVDLIITDHHQPPEVLPEPLALVNPLQPGCAYPFKKLAGAGVAFKLAHALLKAYHPDAAEAKARLKSLLDLVALGTVADIVPLSGENRALVAAGLGLLRTCRRPGIVRLCERAGLKQHAIESGHISFGLAPRLNAAGRTQHAMYSAELLLAEDAREAGRLAEQLELFNNDRRAIEQAMLDEALGMVGECAGDRVIVVAQDGWHPGVLGIVASRLVARLHRPAFVIGLDGETGKGSGRSIRGFDLHAALTAAGEHLVRYGGHKMAAGLTIEAGRLDAFRAAINAHAGEVLDEETMRPLVEIDTEAAAAELTEATVGWLAQLAPHGPENPKPVIAVRDLRLLEDPIVMKERHVKLRTAGPDGAMLTVLGWNMAHRLGELDAYRGAIDVAGTPSLNTWNGRTTVQFEIKDFRVEG